MPVRVSHDIIVIGAGSAGRTLARRLTEERDTNVLLLEAGGWDRDPRIHIPLGWPRLLLRRIHDWMYFAEPENEIAPEAHADSDAGIDAHIRANGITVRMAASSEMTRN